MFVGTQSNQIFHYSRSITLKRVASYVDQSPRYCAQATKLLSKKCPSRGDPLANMCLVKVDSNFRLPSPEKNALSFV